jgi:nucleotide-binding universal stress UspA family protein
MIVREAREKKFDLIVMATHGLRGWRHALLGSVTEGVLHGGNTPVFSVSRPDDRPRTIAAVTKILCPINFSDTARDAAIYAANLAAALGADLIFVHVVDESDIRHAATGAAEVHGWIDPSLRVHGKYREIVLHGGAAERVLDCAEDIGADLLVLGAQHKMFRDGTVVGTTTERIVRFARIPVLTIPRAVERAVKHAPHAVAAHA